MRDDKTNLSARPDRSDGAPPVERLLRPAAVQDADLRRHSRRAFIGAGLSAAASVGAWHWLRTRRLNDGVPWPLRSGFEFNEQFGRDLLSPAGLAPQRPAGTAPSGPRVNGDIGIDSAVDLSKYRLHLSGLAGDDVALTLDDIRELPKTEMTAQLCCIEGWSIFVNWGGVRYTDFAAAYPPLTNGGKPFDVSRPGDLYDYVAMTTPDGLYYVGLDVASVMHPQTMLAYEIDGQPLSMEHGAPLRLVIPTKYGIKNIKRLGTIRYAAVRPADYWAQQGYDWFSGL